MTRTVWIENEPCPSLEELQEMVGGPIELIKLDADTDLIVDEEGLMKSNRSVNDTASMLASREIVGNAVLLIGDESRLK